MEAALIAFAIIGSIFVVYVLFTGARIQGRLTFGIGHPNFLGLVCFGVLCCSLAVPSALVRYALVTLNMIIIVEAEARSCLLASAISIAAHALLTGAHKIRRSTSSAVIALMVVAVGLALGAVFYDEISNSISAVLFLNDRYRGFGTGFTGRTDAWQEAFQLFLANPVFGVGFRTHEQYMTVRSSAHNGYLSVLAETGAFGLSCAVALIGVCLYRLFRMAKAGDSTATVGISFALGYLFVAMFERLLVNFGSAPSVLMWVFLFMAGPVKVRMWGSGSNGHPSVFWSEREYPTVY